jgi:hypothetical protein
MKPAYVDTSLLIGIKFQKFSAASARSVKQYDLFSGELLVAEMLAFGKRESISLDLIRESFKGISWIVPDRSILKECNRVIEAGYARGADLWHLACACYLSPNPKELAFLTLDARQHELAARLGFNAPDFGN